jgi:L-seryl-tRNA(Ser) seleniumtransferase
VTRDDLLRRLPAIHALADAALPLAAAPRWAVVEAARRAVAVRRAAITAGDSVDPTVDAAEVAALADELVAPSLRRVINGTGVVLHTNLGRAPLAPAAIAHVAEVAAGYSNLEYDLAAGERGSRHGHLAILLRELTGAEDAVVVNNNAAATVLALSALAAGREVVVSRGELVEIGGSYRIPDILRLSGCRMVEVGTTNKTRRSDYEDAIGDGTALLLKVHRSNFAVVGFTAEVAASELAVLAASRGLVSMVDLGSGALVPPDVLRAMGLPAETGVVETVASGVDVACFSGDKLLGGPQAGILVGRAEIIARCRQHPLMRAVRPDKLTLAALEATLALYRDGAAVAVPTLAMLSTPIDELRERAERLAAHLAAAIAVPCLSTVGGGAMPLAELPSWGIALDGPATTLDRELRGGRVPVVARVEDSQVIIDLRTVSPGEEADLIAAVHAVVGAVASGPTSV